MSATPSPPGSPIPILRSIFRTTTDKLSATHIERERRSLNRKIGRRINALRTEIEQRTEELARLEKEQDQFTAQPQPTPLSSICTIS